MAALLLAPVLARATLPANLENNDYYKLGYLDVTLYGASPDDQVDDTADIQEALDDAFDNSLVLFFPRGSSQNPAYLISDTLKCRQWRTSTGSSDNGCGGTSISLEAYNPYSEKSYKLVGQHGPNGTRPVIKLVPSGNAFDNSNQPRPMLMLRLYHATGYPAATWAEPTDVMAAPTGWKLNTSYLFNCELRNIDFDCNGYDGAIGVSWPAAQGGVVESVKVNATGAHAGFYGLPGRHWGAINVEVVGGEYGIRSGYGANGAPVSDLVVAGLMLTGVTLTDQTKQAISYWDFVPLMMTGFKITKNIGASGGTTSPLIVTEYASSSANNTICLLDGSIELTNYGGTTNIPAISNPGNNSSSGKGLYARNVFVKGTTVQVQSTGGSGVSTASGTYNQWNRVNEYSYNNLRGSDGSDNGFFGQSSEPCASVTYSSFATKSLLNGSVSGIAEPLGSGGVTAGVYLPADLVTRHLPEGGFPYFEGLAIQGAPAALVVTQLQGINGMSNAVSDASDSLDASVADSNRIAIQAAIDYAAGLGYGTYQGRVFIPKGVFQIRPANLVSGQSSEPVLKLHAETKLYGVGKNGYAQLRAHKSWKPVTANGVFIETEDADDATTYLGNLDMRLRLLGTKLSEKDGQHLYENPFTFVRWSAGPGSVSFNLSAGNDYQFWLGSPATNGVAPFVCLDYTGNAGGRHYFLLGVDQLILGAAGASSRTGAYRSLRISGTQWPLWFYGFNTEGGARDARDTDVEINNAKNVVMLGCKREGGAPAVKIINDSDNIMLLASGSMVASASARTGSSTAGYVEIDNSTCSGIVMANLLVQSVRVVPGGYTLRETSSGAGVLFPLGVSVYQRGTFDYEAASPTMRVVYIDPVGAEDGYILGNTTTMDAWGSGASALRLGDDASNNPYRSFLSFDTSVLPDNAEVISAGLSLMLGSISGNMAGNGFPTAFIADIKSGTFGAAALELGDYSQWAHNANMASFPFTGTIVGEPVMAEFDADALQWINRTGKTQFKLRFTTNSNNNNTADFLGFRSGNDADPFNWPYLRVDYFIPLFE